MSKTLMLLVALVAFSGCGKGAPEWANNAPDVLAMQASVRAAEEAWLAAYGKCDAAVDEIAKKAQRATPAVLTSWPTGTTVCWTPGGSECSPEVMRHLKPASPCGPSMFPAIMASQVRTKDKSRVLAEARKNLDELATRMPPASPALDALYIQECHTTSKLGGVEARFAEAGDDIGGTGGFVKCEVAVMTLDADHLANALAFGDAAGVVAPRGGSAGTYSEQEVSSALDAAMKSTLDEAVGKLVAKLESR